MPEFENVSMRDGRRPIYFDTGYGPTLAWYQPPAGPSTDLGVVLCPPIGAELMCSYRPMRELSRTIAAAGIGVLRPDYHGTGDAAGCDVDPDRVAAWLATIVSAIDQLRELGYRRVGLVGLRMGATLAAVVASGRDDIQCAVLWAPLKSGKAYAREMQMLAQSEANPRTAKTAPQPGAAIEAGGFVLTEQTVSDLTAIDLSALERVSPRTLVIGRDDVAGGKRLADTLGAAYADWPGYAKMMLAPHYAVPAPDTFASLTAWLQQNAGVGSRCPPGDDGQADPQIDLPGGVREQPIRFGPDDSLFGILTSPAADVRHATTIVFSNTGANYHVGPNRMYVRAARLWAQRGYTVLRFDLSGIGESEPRPGRAPNVLYSVESIADFEFGVAEVRRRTDGHGVIAVGMCSGAYVTFHASLRGIGLRAQILVNPQTFYWKEGDSLDAAPAMVADQIRGYGAALGNWTSWRKFLTGRAKYRILVQAFARRAGHLGAIWYQRLCSRLGLMVPADDLARDLRTMVERDIATLIVYSQDDAGIGYLKDRARGEAARLTRNGRLRIETIADADHTFTGQAAQRQLIEMMSSYLSGMA